jgi:hypothetical protein
MFVNRIKICPAIYKNISFDFLGLDNQCDQTFSAVITKSCAEILPNRIFFYQTRANSAFWNFWLCAVIVVTLFGLFHGDSITKPSNNHVNIISNTFLDMKASNINDIQGHPNKFP